jgi:hypothetical protein
MKQKVRFKTTLQVLAFLFSFGMLIIYSILPTTAAWSGIFLPIIGRFWPAKQSPLLITEFVYNPSGEEPAGEWVELFNRGSESLNLVVYKIGDSETQGDGEGMYHFPKGAIIQPGQVIVVANQARLFFEVFGFSPDYELLDSDPSVPKMTKYRDWASGSLNLSNSGDEVLILDQDNEVIDSVSWGNSTFAFDPALPLVDGHSYERRPADSDRNVASDWYDQPEPQPGVVDLVPPTATPTITPTSTYPPCTSANLLISEVLYDPSDFADPTGEWVEVFNRGNSQVNLACIKIGDEESEGGGEGMLIFPQGSTLSAGEIIVIANQAAEFYVTYGFNPDFEIKDSDPEVPDLIRFSSWASGSVNLSNSGDDVLLMDENQQLIDAVSWGNSNFAFDPSVPLVSEGHSLDRHPADQDTDSSVDWQDQDDPNPGEVFLDSLPNTYTPTPTVTITPTVTMTPTGTLIPCDPATLLVSEVLYDPADSGDPDGEWIEIYNIGESDVNLGCVKVGDEETQGGGEGMMSFPYGTRIGVEETIIIARRAVTFFAAYGVIPDYEIEDSDNAVPDMIHYSQWAGGSINLSNSGDDVVLLDEDDLIVDAMSWGNSTFAFNPSAPTVDEDHSLERRPADQDTDSASDWIDQEDPDPGDINLNPPTPTPSPTNTPTSTPTPTPSPSSGLVINEIHADPHYALGDANADGIVDDSDDEFIEIVNDSQSPIDLSSWALGDFFGLRHTFPPGSVVAPGCGIVVFGGGEPSGDFGNSLVQVASSGMLGLNNNGDGVYLYDTEGFIVISYTFGVEASDDQSITRYPDVIGEEPLIKHTTAPGSEGTLFSPGTQIDGGYFSGCSP